MIAVIGNGRAAGAAAGLSSRGGGRRPARGAALILAIALLAVAAVLLAATARLAVLRRETFQVDLRRAQAAWLAESGLERAASRLAAEPGYAGETWVVGAEQLGGREGGRVEIVVTASPEGQDANRLAVRATADYPDDPRRRARATKEMVVTKNGE